jgi:hypothetical protein
MVSTFILLFLASAMMGQSPAPQEEKMKEPRD